MATGVSSSGQTLLSIPDGSKVQFQIRNDSKQSVYPVTFTLAGICHTVFNNISPGKVKNVTVECCGNGAGVRPQMSVEYQFVSLPSNRNLRVWNFELSPEQDTFLTRVVLTIFSKSDPDIACRVDCYNSNELVQRFFFKNQDWYGSSNVTPVLTPIKRSPS